MTRFGNELGRLLLGATVLEGLAAMRRRPLVVVHDREASRVPWEVLRIGDSYPALERGLSRRYASENLSVARWREDRPRAASLRVLMVVNPTLDLPGAAGRARRCGQALRRSGGARSTTWKVRDGLDARLLREIGSGATTSCTLRGMASSRRGIRRAAVSSAPPAMCCAARPRGRGDLPALVFFNACEAARVRRRDRDEPPAAVRPSRSSSLAEALLDGGVANFVGTHWPVGDEAALAFSTRFYDRLLDGERVGDAMLAARRRVFDLGSIDWADYVHYGNPRSASGQPDGETGTQFT